MVVPPRSPGTLVTHNRFAVLLRELRKLTIVSGFKKTPLKAQNIFSSYTLFLIVT